MARNSFFYQINGVAINPPPISYFFQHPWTIGLPLAFVWLGALLLFPLKEQRFRFISVLAIVATALAISNATLALAMPAAAIGAAVLTSIELRRIQWAR